MLFAHYIFSSHKIIKNYLNNRIFGHFFTPPPKRRRKTLYVNALQFRNKTNRLYNVTF